MSADDESSHSSPTVFTEMLPGQISLLDVSTLTTPNWPACSCPESTPSALTSTRSRHARRSDRRDPRPPHHPTATHLVSVGHFLTPPSSPEPTPVPARPAKATVIKGVLGEAATGAAKTTRPAAQGPDIPSAPGCDRCLVSPASEVLPHESCWRPGRPSGLRKRRHIRGDACLSRGRHRRRISSLVASRRAVRWVVDIRW